MKAKSYDKTGREIMVGDVLKVFHFIGARKKKYYMYKYVTDLKHFERYSMYIISHLGTDISKTFNLVATGKINSDIEIVQGYGSNGIHFEDRPKTGGEL